jgi:iron complex outermembrane recepter protein
MFKNKTIQMIEYVINITKTCVYDAVNAIDCIVFMMKRFSHLLPTTLATAIVLVSSPYTYADVQQLDTLIVEAEQQDPNSLSDAPSSVTVLDQAQLQQQGVQSLSDLATQDASLGDGYVPIGYYGNLISRGFALDSANSYLINGQTVRGEQNITFENKQQVEILKGIAALYSPMATPGGVINYVTKRPEQIKALSLSAQEYGQMAAHVDVGGFQGESFGYRINLAGEKLKPYVKDAEGERYFAALALDYDFNENSQLQWDTEWQQQSQYSVAGYQLFNGHLPTGISWDRALGHQAWSKPVKNDSLSSQIAYQYQWHPDWQADLKASFSQVVVDDYSSFPWGCYSQECEIAGLGNQFDQQGRYDLYDFQSPNDTRRTLQASATVKGNLQTERLAHQLSVNWTATQKRHKQHQAINAWVGMGNATQPNTPVPPTEETLGAAYTALKSQQHALQILDEIRWHPEWSALIGAKWLALDEQAYDATRQRQRDTDLSKLLPQLALMYQPNAHLQAYVSYREGLSDGGIAPWYSTNALLSLAPRESRQYELGLQYALNDWSWHATLFELTQDYQYAKAEQDDFVFVSEGEQKSRGLELGISARVNPQLSLNANTTWLDTQIKGAAGFGKQMQNVPKLRALLQANYEVARIQGLGLAADLRYSAAKFADKAATIKAPAYTVFDLSTAYAFTWQSHPTQLRLSLDNVLNKKYWRDVGDYMGDDYLFLGNPRTAKLAMKIQF